MSESRVFDLAKRSIPVVTVVSIVSFAVVATRVATNFERDVDAITQTVAEGFESLRAEFQGLREEVQGLREDHRVQAIHRYQWEQWARMFEMANPGVVMVEMPEPER